MNNATQVVIADVLNQAGNAFIQIQKEVVENGLIVTVNGPGFNKRYAFDGETPAADALAVVKSVIVL